MHVKPNFFYKLLTYAVEFDLIKKVKVSKKQNIINRTLSCGWGSTSQDDVRKLLIGFLFVCHFKKRVGFCFFACRFIVVWCCAVVFCHAESGGAVR